MCTPNASAWAPVVTFLAGAVTAIVAEPVRRWLFRPVLQVSFEPAVCRIETPTTLTTGGVTVGTSRGYWVRVLVRTKKTSLKSRLAKGCRAYLINVETEMNGAFVPSIFVDSLRLKWSSSVDDEEFKPLDIPSDVSQFVDVLSTDRSSAAYKMHVHLVPNIYRELFDESPKTMRLTILVTSDDAKPARTSFVFRWRGAWDTFEAVPA